MINKIRFSLVGRIFAIGAILLIGMNIVNFVGIGRLNTTILKLRYIQELEAYILNSRMLTFDHFNLDKIEGMDRIEEEVKSLSELAEHHLRYLEKSQSLDEEKDLKSIRLLLSEYWKLLNANIDLSRAFLKEQAIVEAHTKTKTSFDALRNAVSTLRDRHQISSSEELARRTLWLLVFSLLLGTGTSAGLLVMLNKTIGLHLGQIMDGIKRVSEGRYDQPIALTTKDELGIIANRVDVMTREIEGYVQRTKESARMEMELVTAKTVQDKLFPPPTSQCGPYQIAAYYQPAIECGGDWWYFTESPEKLYFFIGDVTGHGVQAALLTSAACAVSLELNKITGELIYANASHEPPFLILGDKLSEISSWRDFVQLEGDCGPPLGRSLEAKYLDHRYKLTPGDTVLLYTDGGPETLNSAGKELGTRKLFSKLANNLTSPDLAAAITSMVDTIHLHRGDTRLADDVTLVLCRYKPRPATIT